MKDHIVFQNNTQNKGVVKKKYDFNLQKSFKKILIGKNQTFPTAIEKKVDDEMLEKSVEQKKHVDSLVHISARALYRAKSVFPFDLFPDEITVEPTQVNIIIRDFFFNEELLSIPVKNLADCILDTSIFFGKLTLVDMSFSQSKVSVEYLMKKDARRVRRIIQGLMIVSREDIDISEYNPKELKEEVEKIGTAQPFDHL